MSIRRRLHDAAQAVDELHCDPAQAARDYERFLDTTVRNPRRDPAVTVTGPQSPHPLPRSDHAATAAAGAPAPNETDSDDLGLLIMDRYLRPLSVTAAAERWLAREWGTTSAGLPDVVIGLAERLRDSGLAPEASERDLMVLGDGTLAELMAWPMPNEDGETCIAVAITSAGPGARTKHLIDTLGLTQPEQTATYMVLLGRSSQEIADALQMTVATVHEHLRRVFAKVGVNNRRELSELLFRKAVGPALVGERRM